MRISVVVMSNTETRVHFLKHAIKSVVNQCRRPDEVIVVMSYRDREVEELVSPHGYVIHRVSNRVGPMWATGIKESTGDVIAFLDDDDEWLAGKLGDVERVFSTVDDLGLYHNAFQFIDESGRALSCSELHPYYCSLVLKDRVIVKGGVDRYLRLSYLDWLTADYWALYYNTSSLSSLRDPLIKDLDVVERTNLYSDAMFFIIALSQGYVILHDTVVLTKYRIHTGQTSRRILSKEFTDLVNMDYELFSSVIRRTLDHFINPSHPEK
jgi:Glycosyl transferase family 2.